VAQLLSCGGRSKDQFFRGANCLAFASQLHPNQHLSMIEIAKDIGMEKAAFSRRVQKWRQNLHLPKIGGAWSDEAKKTISAVTKKSHEQRKSEARSKPNSSFLAIVKRANSQS
jgi:hypothetical protein